MRTAPAPGRHRAAAAGDGEAAPGPPPRRPARGWFVGDGPRVRGRAVWLMLAFAGLAGTLLAHLVQVQIGEHQSLAAAAARSHQMSFVLTAQRGEIFDSSGNALVTVVPVYDIYVDPALIATQDRAADAAALAGLLKLPESQVAQVLAEPTQYALLAGGQDQSVKDQLARLPIPGIIPEQREQYAYAPSPVPGESFAANLLGFVNASGAGQYGVEGDYNSLLTGRDGQADEIRDSQGNAIFLNRAQRVPAVNGDDLTLGLDSQVQYWAEQAVAQAVTQDQAQSGQILIMNTQTGAIEGWADYPSYSATDYGSSPVADFLDPAVSSVFQPGSVMKLVTFAGGLQDGAITPGYTFDEQQTVVDGVLIHDWDRQNHGWITMQTVLDESLNNGAIKVMNLEGPNAFYANMLDFGIGAPTGVDLAGETELPLQPQSKLTMLDYSEMSFGQSVAVSPVEMLAAVNAIANGGVWVQPHAVTSIYNPNTGVTTPFTPTTRRVISAQTAATEATMMTHVVDDPNGESKLARIPGWTGEVAGKTGTAQEPVNGKMTGIDVSFVGFLPATDPKFTMMVVLDEPQVPAYNEWGSILAAPVWKQMAELLIDHWHLTP